MLKIPNHPKIKIDNFLLKLDEKIKIIDKSKLILELDRKKVKDLITNREYRSYLKENKNPPLKVVKKFLKLYPNLIEDYYYKSLEYTARNKKVRLPIYLNPKLSYLIGYLHGDGYLTSDKKTYGFIDECKKQLENINLINYTLFGNLGKIRFQKSQISNLDFPHLEIRQFVVNSYFFNVWNITRGIKKEFIIPKLFYKNKEILRWYLIGLFDAEGSLPKKVENVKQIFIDLGMNNKEFIYEINRILNEIFDVKTLKIQQKYSTSPTSSKITTTWEIRIRKYSEISKFLKEIGFHHYEKQIRACKLAKYLRTKGL